MIYSLGTHPPLSSFLSSGPHGNSLIPDWWAYNHHGQTELIREWQTMPNSENAENIIAFKMLDIPEQVIQSIISNPKSKRSQFYRFYGPENLSTK